MAQTSGIIKDQDFLNWTNAWSESEFSKSGFAHLFAQKQEGVQFSDESMFDIVSTIGLDTIQVRFGLNSDDKENQFQVFMYGIDGLGTRVTPYYGSSPIVSSGELGDTPHEVPDVVAQQWMDLWKKALQEDSVNASSFKTNYGYLRGYGYAMRSVVDTLFPGPDVKANIINVFFGLHQYLGRAADPENPTFTFGLILHSQIVKPGDNQKVLGNDNDESVYYDLSTPCPPTC
ncbi:hypothetical protein [Spirosoma validum]|uniref:Uncharacterized protein n=1 Tax=Spirosoma validum TaxID=2771355 RepID=A0A927B4G0_9BACT|nr:hypothetical protein [Spirosoma validum]MBD2755451.1 hypothetical protein [Spirosoma validum]